MTRKWVKDELKKNPAQDFLVKLIKYIREHKQSFIIGAVTAVVLATGTFLILRARMLENRHAAHEFSRAQEAYSRFNYDKAIEKCEKVEENYGNAKIMDQVLYLKGMAYYEKEDFNRSAEVLSSAAAEYPESKIISEIIISLASAYEQLDSPKEALKQFTKIPEDSYLKPEGLAGEARIYELTEEENSAVEIYNRLQRNYSNTYWGEFASKRLKALGAAPEESEEFQPDIQLK
ncbi:MAG: tetratricopeptide repeat protein [Elusimicrobiota bacterium]